MIAAEAMDDDNELWVRYRHDFICRSLRLESLSTSHLTESLLESYMGDLKTSQSKKALPRLAMLHIRLHVHQLDLTRVTRILRPVSMLHPELTLTPTSSEKTCFNTHNVPAIIIGHIFSLMREACMESIPEKTERCNQYLKSYQDLVSLFSSSFLKFHQCGSFQAMHQEAFGWLMGDVHLSLC